MAIFVTKIPGFSTHDFPWTDEERAKHAALSMAIYESARRIGNHGHPTVENYIRRADAGTYRPRKTPTLITPERFDLIGMTEEEFNSLRTLIYG